MINLMMKSMNNHIQVDVKIVYLRVGKLVKFIQSVPAMIYPVNPFIDNNLMSESIILIIQSEAN